MSNVFFRRYSNLENRHYYNDHRSWRDWYTEPFAGKSLGPRSDEREHYLGDLEILVDRTDPKKLVYMTIDEINKMYKESKLCQNKNVQPVDHKSE